MHTDLCPARISPSRKLFNNQLFETVSFNPGRQKIAINIFPGIVSIFISTHHRIEFTCLYMFQSSSDHLRNEDETKQINKLIFP